MSLQETFGRSLANYQAIFMCLVIFLIIPDLLVIGFWSNAAGFGSYMALFVILVLLVLVNVILRIFTLCSYSKQFASPQQLRRMSRLLICDICTHILVIPIFLFTFFVIYKLSTDDDDDEHSWNTADYVLSVCIGVVVLGHSGLFILEIILYRRASSAWKTWNYELVAAREPREQVDLVVE